MSSKKGKRHSTQKTLDIELEALRQRLYKAGKGMHR